MEEYLGYWLIPNVSKQKSQGILRIDNEKIELELVGTNDDLSLFYGFDEPLITRNYHDIKNIELINGYAKNTKENKDVMFSLINPDNTECSSSLLIRIKYEVKHLVKKMEVRSMPDFKIQNVFFKYDHIDHWVGKFGYNIDNHPETEDFRVTIEFSPPKPITLFENNKYKMYLMFRASSPALSNNKSDLNLIQSAFFNIEFKRRQKFDEIIRLGNIIRDFFSFAVRTPVGIKQFEFRCYSKNAAQKNKIDNQTAEVIHKDHVTSKISKIYNHDLLINYSDLANSKENIIEAWIKKYDLLSPVMKLYFDNLYNENIYLETGFLNYIFALEVYHKRVINSKQVELRKRLEELLKRYSKITSQMIKNRTSFLNKVVNSRNYFVHYNLKIKKKNILKEEEMFFSSLKLKILIQIILLDELGFDINYIENKIKGDINNYWVFNKK